MQLLDWSSRRVEIVVSLLFWRFRIETKMLAKCKYFIVFSQLILEEGLDICAVCCCGRRLNDQDCKLKYLLSPEAFHTASHPFLWFSFSEVLFNDPWYSPGSCHCHCQFTKKSIAHIMYIYKIFANLSLYLFSQFAIYLSTIALSIVSIIDKEDVR